MCIELLSGLCMALKNIRIVVVHYYDSSFSFYFFFCFHLNKLSSPVDLVEDVLRFYAL